MTLEKKAVKLCELFGIDKATTIETDFLKLYSAKYFDDLVIGNINMDDYMKDMNSKLERYLGMVISHYENNIPKSE